MVRSFIFPCNPATQPQAVFADQFAFRPTGSTIAAMVALLRTVCIMLSVNPYVLVFVLDFSKAFDTVRHKTVMEKVADLHMPDQIYNWIVDFLCNHSHCTRYANVNSSVATVTASIIQGSGLGPTAYLVNAADLRPLQADNDIIKLADDTYLIVSAVNSSYCSDELSNIHNWQLRTILNSTARSLKKYLPSSWCPWKICASSTPMPVYRDN